MYTIRQGGFLDETGNALARFWSFGGDYKHLKSLSGTNFIWTGGNFKEPPTTHDRNVSYNNPAVQKKIDEKKIFQLTCSSSHGKIRCSMSGFFVSNHRISLI